MTDAVERAWQQKRRSFAVSPTLILLLGFFVFVNTFAGVVAPALFEADRARGPFTKANNLELTRVYSRAIEGYQRIIDQFPESRYRALSEIGIANSYLGLGDREEAIARFRRLLIDLRDDPAFQTHRLTLLDRLATAYEEAGDAEGFRDAYAMLLANYLTAPATLRAARFFAELEASEAAAAQMAQDGGANVLELSMPETVISGDEFIVTVSLLDEGLENGPFALAVNMAFWDGFTLLRSAPATNSVSEFWGRRFLQYTKSSAPMIIELRLRAGDPGTYMLDVDIERSFEVRELGLVQEITVETP